MPIFPPELIEAIPHSAHATSAAIEAVVRHIERDLRLAGETRFLNLAPAMAVAAMTGRHGGAIGNETMLPADAAPDCL
ncbi:hypothetical protein [Sphingopyxis chilensis]